MKQGVNNLRGLSAMLLKGLIDQIPGHTKSKSRVPGCVARRRPCVAQRVSAAAKKALSIGKCMLPQGK